MMENQHMDLQQYLTALGVSTQSITKILTSPVIIRNLDLIRGRVAFYQDFLRVDQVTVGRLINRFPFLLNFDTANDGPTGVKSEIKNYQTILQVDERTVAKMVLYHPQMLGHDNFSDSPTATRAKIKDFQTLLQTDMPTVTKILVSNPSLLGREITGDSPTAIASKLEFFKSAFHVDMPTIIKMVVDSPVLLNFDITGQGPTSLTAKINKLHEVIPARQLRECVIKRPELLNVPAQSFKIRYMLAENIGVMPVFIMRCGFLTNQNKVWARDRHLNRHPGIFKAASVYVSEKRFNRLFGVQTAELLPVYPLNHNAVENIEHTYHTKTGVGLTLDQQERAALGL